MKTLEKEIVWTGDGFGASEAITLRQIKREGNVCLYQRIKKNGTTNGYEVFTVKVIQAGASMPGGSTVQETYESYPRANSFGRTAWQISQLSDAEKRFQELLTKQNAPEDEVENEGLTIPVAEFTVGELAEANSVQYPVAFLFVKDAVQKGTIVFKREERRNPRGKASKIYAKA